MSDLPKYLCDRHGKPKEPPAEVRHLFECPACGARLVRAQKFWVCPAALHSKAKGDRVLLGQLAELSPADGRWRPLDVLRIQLRIQRKLGVRLERERERERESQRMTTTITPADAKVLARLIRRADFHNKRLEQLLEKIPRS